MKRSQEGRNNAPPASAVKAPSHLKKARDAHLDRLLDEALADSFPASDPVSWLTTEEDDAAARGGAETQDGK